jgi:hypothetical protein
VNFFRRSPVHALFALRLRLIGTFLSRRERRGFAELARKTVESSVYIGELLEL